MKRLLRLIVLLPILCIAYDAISAEEVVLQLKWEHEFQFAGYYAAKWKGYYSDSGLNVEIRPASRPDGSIVSPINEIVDKQAQFAIGSLDILLSKDNGVDLVVLAPIFQRSDLELFALTDTPIETIAQLSKLRIAAFQDDKIFVRAIFKAHGFDPDEILFVDEAINLDTLINKKADVLVTYNISAMQEAKDHGIKLNRLIPSDFGINFYGDTLYTSKDLVQSSPELVEKFLTASKKGWIYALENKEEIARRIADELPRHVFGYDDSYAYNMSFAEHIDSLILYPEIPLGHVNQEKWLTMNERIRSLGIVNKHLNSKDFFFKSKDNYFPKSQQTFLSILVVVMLLGLFYSWNRRKLALSMILVVLLTLDVGYLIEKNLAYQQQQADKFNLLTQLNSVAAKLKGNLQTNLSILSGFAAYISATPELGQEEFDNYAKEVFIKAPLLINFAAAKNLVVNYVYPFKGNEKVIGLDYQKNLAQKDMVLQVVQTGQLLVAGPVELVQGGLAFIGRAPVFTGHGLNRKLWGIISAPLDAKLLFQSAGLQDLGGHLKLAIKSYDLHGVEDSMFWGDNSVFQDAGRTQLVINVGGGTWHLAAIRDRSNQTVATSILSVRFILFASALFFCAFMAVRFRQQDEKHRMQKTILDNQALLEKVGSVARIGGWKIDADLNFIQWSKQTSLIFEKPIDFVPENIDSLACLFEEAEFKLWLTSIHLALQEGREIELELKVSVSRDRDIWIKILANASIDEQSVHSVTGTIQDITRRVLNARVIEHQATHDSLTDLPNRVLFNDRLSESIERARRQDTKIAVLFIDLDRFKPVNDNHGHQVGDRLLIEAARRIRHCVRESDTVSRLSGDEFGVIIPNIVHFNDVVNVTEHILKEMAQVYVFGQISVHCSSSIGIAIYPDDAQTAEALIRKSDQAMYEVKRSGRNASHFYTSEMQQKSEYRHALLNLLIKAVNEQKLSAYYQPIVDLKDDRIAKCESLARWIKEDGEFVPPDEFIVLAEESGLINRIDLFMLEKSAKTIANINKNETCQVDIGLTINVSPRLFHTKDRALEKWLLSIKTLSQQTRITVEITERLLTQDSDKALEVLTELKSYGVRIAIDDFGTGYSSLNYLIKFPVDIIKIDRSFVERIGNDVTTETLIETIIVMAKKLEIRVVAEGIETQAQLTFLKLLQCDYGQGYFLARPMNDQNLLEFINQKSKS